VTRSLSNYGLANTLKLSFEYVAHHGTLYGMM